MHTLIILCLLGIVSLCAEIFNFKKILLPLVFVGIALAIGTTAYEWNTNTSYFNDMIVYDNYALAFTILILCISLAWFAISPAYFSDPGNKGDHVSLIIFAIIGATIMTAFSNMIMLFLGIEILSIAMYILAGSNKTSLASNEAALKYFLIGAFSTCFLLFGIALIYGEAASFNLKSISSFISSSPGSHAMLYAGILLMMSSLAFKVSAAPFHFWAPDVYEGSPTVITAFMSTVVKTAAFAAFLKLFVATFAGVESLWSSSLYIISAATIIIGNVTAVYQKSFKRMLAYSSISHAGYMLIAILSMNKLSASSLLFYATAYSVSSIASFAILLLVNKQTGSESIESFNGLARRNPFLAAITVIAMLSLAGIPPTAGFFGKYFIFSAAMQNNLTGLVLIAIAGSLVGVFYYFRIIIALFKDKEDSPKVLITPSLIAVLSITAIISIALGVFPGILAGLLT